MTAPSVLVTGGSGFIGSALVRRLHGDGVDVRVADLRAFPDPEVACVTGDLASAEVAEEALSPGTTAVVHLAAMTSVLESVRRPEEVFEVNVAMTSAVLERARRLGVERFVLASTNAVIGSGLAERAGPGAGRPEAGRPGPEAGRPGRRTVIDESAPLRPLTPYGATKAAAEMLLSAYGASYPMATGWVRLTNVYGPGMGAKDSIVPRLMRAALSGAALDVYGDGHQVRDYLHLDDAVAALDLAWRLPLCGPLTVGSGTSISVLELLAAARRATGRPIPSGHVEPRPGEMRAVVVDTTRARALGFAPRVALEEGLGGVWEDFRRREG